MITWESWRIHMAYPLWSLMTIQFTLEKIHGFHQTYNTKIIDLSDFINSLIFKKKCWQGVPSGHTLNKIQFHGDKSVKFIDLSEFFNSLVKSEMWTSISLFVSWISWTCVMRGYHLEHFSKKISSMTPIHGQTPPEQNVQENFL